MCGIAGFVSASVRSGSGKDADLAKRMVDSLRHRGPDRQSFHVENGVALCQSRLSIIDLSSTGDQPMESQNGRYVFVFNGEIYNAAELRRELENDGCHYEGHSDTRALLESMARYGVVDSLSRSVGMFAFALWDRKHRRLTLGRDRLGIKPMYWTLAKGILLFGSELKALRLHPVCPKKIDRDALAAYLRHNYVPAPRTIYEGIQKLNPGHVLVYENQRVTSEEAFWALDRVLDDSRNAGLSQSERLESLHDVLRDAVQCRMISDVPLGAFLSGGVDSSLVTALMQEASSQPVKTFSVAFQEGSYDESRQAAAVAGHLGTDHTTLTATPEKALDIIPRLPTMYDEPFADSSQIPTHLVSALTREHVTVALSGDGGDEVFGGYTRYLIANRLGGRLARIPMGIRRLAGRCISAVPTGVWDSIARIIPENRRPRLVGDRAHKLAGVLTKDDVELYRQLISQWHQPERILESGLEPGSIIQDPSRRARFDDFTSWMQYIDTLTYLPDDILTKVDRASMAVGLEARVPLIDHRVVAEAWSLPLNMKIRGGETKWALRALLERYLPRDMFERPKMGFAVPIDNWLRGPLRDWAEDLLSETALKKTGLFRTLPIRERWLEHVAGNRNWHYPMWTILMAQAWAREWKPTL